MGRLMVMKMIFNQFCETEGPVKLFLELLKHFKSNEKWLEESQEGEMERDDQGGGSQRGEAQLRKGNSCGWQWAEGELAAANRKLCSPELGTLSDIFASFSKASASSPFCKDPWEWQAGADSTQ